MMRKKSQLQNGFTLTELLIVVVIIGVLSASVLPKLTSQQGKARTAEAIGIMTQIHRAVLRHRDENGALPGVIGDVNIKTTLGIDYSAPAAGWSFGVDATGKVTATNATLASSKLFLCYDGTWGGSGSYNPTSGALWPHLPGATCT